MTAHKKANDRIKALEAQLAEARAEVGRLNKNDLLAQDAIHELDAKVEAAEAALAAEPLTGAIELTKALSDLSRSPISADRLKRLEKLLIELFERIDALEREITEVRLVAEMDQIGRLLK